MKKLLLSAVAASAVTAGAAQAQDVTLTVHYANPDLWTEVQGLIADAYMAENPGVTIEFDAPAESYAEGVQRLLREAVSGELPDVAYLGLNRWRILEDRDLTVALDPIIESEEAFEALGYTRALRSLGQYQGVQHALAASASTLVVYVNPDLIEQAGGSVEDFPSDFDGLIELAASIDALGDTIEGVWVSAHDWRFQSMLGSYGGRPLNADETDVTFDSDAGVAAASLYGRFAAEAGMDGYGGDEARQAFAAGTLGIYIDSSSYLTRLIEAAGDRFDVTLLPFIVAAEDDSTVYFPTGGSAIVMLTEDEAMQDVAWDYMMFATGPEGARIVVENSGYAPTNSIVLEDESYLGEFYASNENARRAHAQVAAYSGPWFSYPGAEGVAVTDLIAAGLVEIIDGADPAETIATVAEDVRDRLGM